MQPFLPPVAVSTSSLQLIAYKGLAYAFAVVRMTSLVLIGVAYTVIVGLPSKVLVSRSHALRAAIPSWNADETAYRAGNLPLYHYYSIGRVQSCSGLPCYSWDTSTSHRKWYRLSEGESQVPAQEPHSRLNLTSYLWNY